METFGAAVVAILVLAILTGAILAVAHRHRGHRPVPGTTPSAEGAHREVTQIGLGGSIMEAQVIEQRLRAQGYTVALLKHEHPETGSFTALGSAALLVLQDEEQAVRQELDGFGY